VKELKILTRNCRLVAPQLHFWYNECRTPLWSIQICRVSEMKALKLTAELK